jgi:hypothetical protein
VAAQPPRAGVPLWVGVVPAWSRVSASVSGRSHTSTPIHKRCKKHMTLAHSTGAGERTPMRSGLPEGQKQEGAHKRYLHPSTALQPD